MKLREVNKIAYSQWSHEKNKRLNSDEISSTSKEIVYWQCDQEEDHIWASHIFARAESDTSCPLCSNVKNYPTGPELLKVQRMVNDRRRIAHYILNTWHCKNCKHVWQTESGDAIPITALCNNCFGETSEDPLFTEEYPELAKEWSTDNMLPAAEVLSFYPLNAYWLCKDCANTWRATIEERRFNKKNCPYCSRKLPLPGIDSLAALYPSEIEEWVHEVNAVLPEEVFPDNQTRPIMWRCKTCHILYSCTAYEKTSKLKGCNNCNSEHPVRPERYLFLKGEFLEGSGNIGSFKNMKPDYTASLKWRCSECGDVFIMSFRERYYEGRDCACIEGWKAIPGKTSFQALHNDLMKEWHIGNWFFIDPDMILPNYSGSVWWSCSTCQYSYSMSPQKRLEFKKRKKTACLKCKGLRRKVKHFL